MFDHDCLNKLVKVVWKDSTFDLGWNYENRKPILPTVTTYGIVTFLDKDVMEISSTIGKERGWLNPLQIPTGSVESVEVL
jgi:hypothetical protein